MTLRSSNSSSTGRASAPAWGPVMPADLGGVLCSLGNCVEMGVQGPEDHTYSRAETPLI